MSSKGAKNNMTDEFLVIVTESDLKALSAFETADREIPQDIGVELTPESLITNTSSKEENDSAIEFNKEHEYIFIEGDRMQKVMGQQRAFLSQVVSLLLSFYVIIIPVIVAVMGLYLMVENEEMAKVMLDGKRALIFHISMIFLTVGLTWNLVSLITLEKVIEKIIPKSDKEKEIKWDSHGSLFPQEMV